MISLFPGLLISDAALPADGPKIQKTTMFKKIILTIGLIIVLGVVGLAVYIYASGPPLPPNSDGIISQVLRSELPEIFRGKTGYAKSGDINIWYESIEPDGATKGAVLLLAGISSDAVAWPPKFLDALAAAGYQVIRTDHRGTGMSDWIEDWDSDNPYTLDDMANDGIAVLDALGIEEAHVIGVSMGGMIAQQMSIDHPDRVLSLTSIMSSGNIADPNLPPISMDIAQELVKASLKYGLIKRLAKWGASRHLNGFSISSSFLYHQGAMAAVRRKIFCSRTLDAIMMAILAMNSAPTTKLIK